jgi:hypothetical protein
MRVSRMIMALLLSLALPASSVHAQYGGRGRDRDDWRERPLSHADSTKSLAGPWQLWLHAGINGVAAPRAVSQRYVSGLAAGVAGDRRFGDRIALRAHLGYEDLPSKQSTFVFYNGTGFTNSTQGHGWLATATAGIAVRVWDHLWLEGGGGAGYFRSGIPASYLDLVSGRTVAVQGATGGGSLWQSGARFEFMPRRRDRMFVDAEFQQLNRGGTPITMWTVRLGYRAR